MPSDEKWWVPHAKLVLVKMAALARSRLTLILYILEGLSQRNGDMGVVCSLGNYGPHAASQVAVERDFESGCLCDPTAHGLHWCYGLNRMLSLKWC